MQRIYMAMWLSAVACLPMGCSSSEVGATAPDSLRGVRYVDMYAPTYTTQRPLLAGKGRHYPGGTEMVFKRPDKEAECHAVFPKGVTAPRENELTKALVLHGRFEAIRSTPGGGIKGLKQNGETSLPTVKTETLSYLETRSR